MSMVQVVYHGNQTCEAIDRRSGRRLASDCSLTKGTEFGPESLVAAGLGACMLISMSSAAERHGIDVSGSRIDVDTTLGGRPQMRIEALDIAVHVPGNPGKAERNLLRRAADACPIKHSFRAETQITTHFAFGETAAETG